MGNKGHSERGRILTVGAKGKYSYQCTDLSASVVLKKMKIDEYTSIRIDYFIRIHEKRRAQITLEY